MSKIEKIGPNTYFEFPFQGNSTVFDSVYKSDVDWGSSIGDFGAQAHVTICVTSVGVEQWSLRWQSHKYQEYNLALTWFMPRQAFRCSKQYPLICGTLADQVTEAGACCNSWAFEHFTIERMTSFKTAPRMAALFQQQRDRT